MAKLPRLTDHRAEKLLLKAGFEMIRSKGSHRIYKKGDRRIVVPFHGGKILHPKIVKQVLKTIND
ncbi:MAG: addiction module toxin, HicA family [Atribacteria sp.]|nr:addiction module toxin, HicA family [Candidatus Atribacteria bacterium]MBU1290205.1 type II toxin-antitoxin system HicA family toxin [bacterium]MBU1427899.1 type II toxin-antitoxin system HicA family toxin [bacterium]MBU2439656.1 type II toxin-antitoxin system HicA family toxin [bacterium]MBU4047398.1 type II toxin-antitoxin system HicA family toxin [bacterium]